MVHCSSCGRAIEKIPDWMQAISVEFVCNNCPNRQIKNIALVDLDAGLHKPEPEAEPLEEAEVEEAEVAEEA